MSAHGLILAGGEGRRLGRADKASLVLGGRRLLDLVTERLVPQVRLLALSANGDPARYAGFQRPILADPDLDGMAGLGPMAGVLAGLDWLAEAGGDHLVTVAVDTPFFPADLVQRLREAGTATGGFALTECGGRLHPTFGLWPLRMRASLRAALLAGERRIGTWMLAEGAARAAIPSAIPDPFFNINTADDLALAESLLPS